LIFQIILCYIIQVFFTATSSEEELKKYIEDNLKLMENIDVLAQFNLYEFFFKKKLKKCENN
jgi:hypothetical protein